MLQRPRANQIARPRTEALLRSARRGTAALSARAKPRAAPVEHVAARARLTRPLLSDRDLSRDARFVGRTRPISCFFAVPVPYFFTNLTAT